MKVNRLNNVQFEVKSENLTIIQTVINGQRYNDCTFFTGEYYESISQHDSRLRPLFIALHNYKIKY